MLVPARTLEVEISRPIQGVGPGSTDDGSRYLSAVVLVRLHGQPLGTLELDLTAGPIDAGQIAEQIWGIFEPAILNHLHDDGIRQADRLTEAGIGVEDTPGCLRLDDTALPFASVVISTRERPGSLAACLDSILQADYPHFEVLVVDNAPKTIGTCDLFERRYAHLPNVRYLLEPKVGTSAGRNCGLAAATGDIVVFVDDDVIVDRLWLRSLASGFQAAADVACVTGMILPAELHTQSQLWIEEFGGFDKGYERKIFDLAEHALPTPLYPYALGQFGSGASMAFDTRVFRALGGFDCALGGGTPALGGEDLDAFLRIVVAGHRLVYEPRALVRHRHRREYADFRRTVRGYGVGLSAVLTKALLNRSTRVDVLKRVPRGITYFLSPSSPKNQKKTASYPRQLTMVEIAGAFVGPIAYLRSRRRASASVSAP